ncbi:helix-turn-helix domain-containing protein [Paraburkholderia tagetis]|uniref:Helix-turn-helix domain-containing protein n=1 Tax=Paraburkholderia tagetis TaxID=2913261 RepID=A0A9X1UMA0_9BURK|nr:helix-turn-helix domain-containing protein [Paraburkholderia tagetis]MCG5077995.1 helix-turn-helix domain-containing protein [Paraburkholderia tagetis]
MRKLEIADAEIMQLAIRQEIERSEESRYDHRLHGVLLVSCGYSCTEVGQLLGQAATTVQRWVGRFERDGFDGLREGDRPGRPRALDESQWHRVEADLRKTPREFGFEAGLWDGSLLSEHLRKNYGVRLGVRQCQRLFGQMGFRLRKPRPQVAQSDPARVAAVKKTPAPGKARGH